MSDPSRTTRWRKRKAVDENIHWSSSSSECSVPDEIESEILLKTKENDPHSVDKTEYSNSSSGSFDNSNRPPEDNGRTGHTHSGCSHHGDGDSAEILSYERAQLQDSVSIPATEDTASSQDVSGNIQLEDRDDQSLEDDQHSVYSADNGETRREENDASESDLFSEAESSSDEDAPPGREDPPLYQGCRVSVMQSLLAILTFSTEHNLSGAALSDLLSLVSLHLPVQPNALKSLFRFNKYFSRFQTPLQYHYYCVACYVNLESKEHKCNQCAGNVKSSFFVTMSVIDQLKSLFKRPGFATLLNFRSERVKKNELNYEDIYDGSLYKRYVDNGFLADNNISFLWNSDGVSIFKSSKYEVWPVYLVINELPYSERFKEENLILAGLWFGEKKPVTNLFLSKMKQDFTAVFRGIEVKTPDNAVPKTIRGMVLCGTCDLPAKAKFLNMMPHNGYFSCSVCLIKGEKSPRTGNVLTFPVCDNSLRTDECNVSWAREAVKKQEPVFGLKGPTYLSLLVPECYSSLAIDVMHCCFQGVSKRLMHLWFDKDYKDEVFSLRTAVEQVSDFVKIITPPSFINRMPRSIVDHMAYWKASEYKAWLMYYSVPILREVMSDEYFNHHLMLVCALHYLNEDSVSDSMISKSSLLLNEYVTKFQVLYGLRYLSMNFHLLIHLPDSVKKFGPLWAVSCFRFEDLNGKLKKHVHGTRYAETQIPAYVSTIVNLHSEVRDLPQGNPVKNYCEKLLMKKKIRTVECIMKNLFTVGKYDHVERGQISSIMEALSDMNVFGNVFLFSSLLKGRILYHSSAYKRAKKTLSSSVLFDSIEPNQIGIVRSFVKVTQCECTSQCACAGNYFAVINVLEKVCVFRTVYPSVGLNFISECKETETIVAVPIRNVSRLCVLMSTPGGKLFICEPVNIIELE